MRGFIGRVLRLKKEIESKADLVEENFSAWDHAVIAYNRGATLPGCLRIFAGITEAKSDDKLDDAVLVLLGEAKQSVYNASELMRANAGLINGFADQLDSLFEALDRAEREPLKQVLEGGDED